MVLKQGEKKMRNYTIDYCERVLLRTEHVNRDTGLDCIVIDEKAQLGNKKWGMVDFLRKNRVRVRNKIACSF